MLRLDVACHAAISHIEIVGPGRIFSRQCVDLFHHRHDAKILTAMAHKEHSLVHVVELVFKSDGTGYLEVGESIDFSLTEKCLVKGVDVLGFQFLVNIDDMFQLLTTPLVYLGQLVDLVNRISLVHGFGDDKHTLVGGFTQGRIDVGNLKFLILDKSVHPLSYHAETFLNGFFKIAPDGHHFANRLHARTEFLVYATKFGKVPTGNLAHDIIKGRFEEGRGGLGDGVLQFKQAVTHTQFGGHESQRITRGL